MEIFYKQGGVGEMMNGRWRFKMRELAGIIVVILLISTISSAGATSSAERGASNYYNRLGIELSNERRYDEAKEKFDTVDWLNSHDLADAPVMTTIDVSGKEDTVNNSRFYSREKREGATLLFGLSNYNTVGDMFIKSVYIDVLKYSPKRLSNEIRHNLSLVEDREYRCTILPQLGSYECQMTEVSNKSLKLSPGEQERINITLKAKEEGVYLVQVGFKYEIGSRSKRYSARQNLTIEFYDSSKRSDGWRGT
jgi:hypothetical protein